MARALSPEKRQLILQSATLALAEKGLAASTSAIAKGAGLAEGTIFTYFSTKEVLFNDLYIELKTEAFRRIQDGFPEGAPLRQRVQHLWTEYLRWATEKPQERKVAMLLHLSPVISDESRARMNAQLGRVSDTMGELATQGVFRSFPPSFATASMKSLQEAVLEMRPRSNAERERFFAKAFEAFWTMAI